MDERQRLRHVVEQRLRATEGERKQARAAIARGEPLEAETDSARRDAFRQHIVGISSGGDVTEAIQGSTVDFIDAAFLSVGASKALSVALLRGPKGSALGTGFLISPRLLITNNHVLRTEAECRAAQAVFEYETDGSHGRREATAFALDPDAFFLTDPVDGLDYTIVAVGARVIGPRQLVDLGYCSLSARPDKHAKGMWVDIIQHPEGGYKKVVVRENRLVARHDGVLHYEADTEGGSSGSPVFNDAWEVVALHHWGEPHSATKTVEDQQVSMQVNEGIRVSSIVAQLVQRVDGLPEPRRALLLEALRLGEEPAAGEGGAASGEPPDGNGAEPGPPKQESASTARRPAAALLPALAAKGAKPMTDDQAFASGTVRVVVPLEISVRVLTPARVQPFAVVPGGAPGLAVFPEGAERVTIDTDYSNRRGYDPAFLPEMKVRLPGLPAGAKAAPLREGTAGREEGLLDYEHFSVKINPRRRMAFFTATNIDGLTYLPIDRKTGEPKEEAAEGGETWFDDDRMDPQYTVVQDFYSANSTYFDRGHLTRRNDPTWGTAERAVRANADTFHRTNCTPQHWRFNQSTRFWQGVERFYLEFGVIVDRSRLTVLQGPVFSDAEDPAYPESSGADGEEAIRVPLQFWKIVARVENGRPRVTGFLVSQAKILPEERKGMRRPVEGEPPQVDQWRASIQEIERLTGLDFGDLRAHDTFERGPEGAEGARRVLITGWDDIR